MNVALIAAGVFIAGNVALVTVVGPLLRKRGNERPPVNVDELDDAAWEHALRWESRTLEPDELPSRNQP